MIAEETAGSERLRALTQELLACARRGDWEKASGLEVERRPGLYRVFGGMALGINVQHQTLLTEVLAADREILRLAQQRRAELGGLLQQVNQGRTALRAYESNCP